ncbi:hypothetical protein [Nostoc sp.]
MGGAERNPTHTYQDVGLRKASTQPTIFLQQFSLVTPLLALDVRTRYEKSNYAQCPMPNAQCPMPN